MRRMRLAILGMAVMILAGGCGLAPAASPTPSLTPVPTDTSTPIATATTIPTATLTRTPLPTLTPTSDAPQASATPVTDAEIEEGTAPPFSINLPQGWQEGFGILPVNDGITQTGVPVAIYTGPIPELADTTGWVVVLWGFPSIGATGQPDLWADGLRYLRGALLDTTCNIGTDLSRFFTVGTRDDAVGTYFQAVGCQGEPDTAGWFAGVNEQGGNYVFFAYVDPLDNYPPSIPTLQGILDSIVWQPVPTRTPAP